MGCILKFNDFHARQSASVRYPLAIFIFLIALALRFWVDPPGSGMQYMTFYPATLICFYLCGVGPGALVAIICAVVADYIFVPPYWSISLNEPAYVGLTNFLAFAGMEGFVVRRLQIYSAQLRNTLMVLKQSEERYRGMLEDQTELICRFKTDGTILYVNDAYCRLFGKTNETLIGSRWQPVAFSEDILLIHEKLAMLTPDHPVITIENRVIVADGSTRWGQFVNRGFFDQQGNLIEIQAVGRDITERKLLEAQLAASAKEIEDLYDHAPCGYHSLGPDGSFLRINATELAWIGVERDDVIGKLKFSDVITSDSKELFKQAFPSFLRDGHIEGLEFDLVGKHGVPRHVLVSATAVTDADGQYVMSRSVMYDISELKKVEDQLHQLTHEQHAMLDNDLVGIMRLKDRKILWKNKAIERMFGYGQGELRGQPTRILYPDEASYLALGATAYPILKAHGVYRAQLEMMRKDGEKIWVDLSGAQLSGTDGESLWMIVDITAMKTQQDKIEHIAFHDVLTGLPNRLLLSDRMEQALAQAERSQHLLAVCYFDLDGFKPVNDTYGHEIGDTLLKEVARRLELSIRANDTASRLGGDEFVLLLTNLENVEEYKTVLERVIKAINEPYELGDGQKANVTVSVGVTVFPLDSHDPDTLLRHADQAMYQAKKLGRNQTCLFRSDVSE
jgi:diguanylate cyclase (GGDEF)-like protein/PAS domain S-box-containing protein